MPGWRNWQTRGIQNPLSERACGFKSHSGHHVMSQDIGTLEPRFGGSSRFEAWLVADVWVEFQVSDEFAGGFVHDSDVEVVDDEDDGCSFEGPAEADVVHAACTSQGHGSGSNPAGLPSIAVVAYPVVGLGPFIMWLVFG